MRNRQKSETYIMILLLTISLVAVTAVINGESTTVVSMDDVDIDAGSSGSGVLKVNDVSNLGSFSVDLSWNPSVVDVVDVDDGDFIIERYIDHNAGFVNITGYSMSGVSGDFDIASVKFKAVGSVGESCAIEIVYSQLLTADNTSPAEIDHYKEDGTAHVKAAQSGGDGGSLPLGTNQPPVANASASQTTGFVGESIILDGSLSTDDGTITNYTWDFRDGSIGYGIKIKHTFTAQGRYTVMLTVTDDGELTDDDLVSVEIKTGNTPPTKPTVTGPKTGHKSISYEFSAVSTDADNDTIQYTFNWGDSETDTTDFLPSGTTTTQTHSWAAPGIYEISVKAYDNETESATTKLTVLIDAHWVKNIGYLIDDDSDGTYDTFYSNSTKNQTDVNKQDDGTYLIDNDGDGNWDYVFDVEAGTFAEYTPKETSENNAIWYALGLGTIFAIIILLLIFRMVNAKKKKEKETKK